MAEDSKPDSISEAVADLRQAAQDATVAPTLVRRRARIAQYTFNILLLTFFLFAIAAHIDNYFRWDVYISHAIQSITLPGFATLMRVTSYPGDYWLAETASVTAVFSLLMILRYRTEAGMLALCAGAGQFLNITLKFIVNRPRPTADVIQILVAEHTQSFPSGHVMHYVCYYGFLLFLSYTLLKRSWLRWGLMILFGSLIILVGFSRIYLGAHWPSDVTAAYLGGGLWLSFIISRYRKRAMGK